MSESAMMTAEPMEAVIISGPRKGEIITLPDDMPEVSDEEWAMLNEALDGMLAAVDRLLASVRSFRTSLHERKEAT